MFFVVRSNDNFNFPLGLIKYIFIVIVIVHWLNDDFGVDWEVERGQEREGDYIPIAIFTFWFD